MYRELYDKLEKLSGGQENIGQAVMGVATGTSVRMHAHVRFWVSVRVHMQAHA